MKTESPRHLRNPLLALLFLAAAAASAAQIAMAAEPEQQAAVHIVYVDRPEDADPEEFHIRTLAPVLGRFVLLRLFPAVCQFADLGGILAARRRPGAPSSTTTSTPPADSPQSSPPSRSRTSRSNQVSFRLCRARPTSSMDMRVDMPAQRAQWALCESLE
ncbi:unnamed protein product [Triticum turgidum subsp. durum]|uniref:Inhibitor I9 domain-containing protein n=1 Tax=Triticum turgidum subsp. durum TaxID=4567 RepID=A0A9R0V0J9_TRITD|nr:unnamed protein product [Triticum turgidum subsp. durum]